MSAGELTIVRQQEFLRDTLAGLTRRPKTLPAKYLYDRRGSELFERICELPEYYLTRTETAILQEHAPAISEQMGTGALVIEPGSGSSRKARLLLRQLSSPAGYVPVDISRDAVAKAASRLEDEFPDLPIFPVHADFQSDFMIPTGDRKPERRIVFFPGSTIGNFEPAEAVQLLRRLSRLAGPGGGLLVGVDLAKEADVLVPAYDDSQGVTAAFNLNLLRRLRRELGAEVDGNLFTHCAIFDRARSRMEMHLISKVDQQIVLAGTVIRFAAGESIHTENSYKYAPTVFRQLLSSAGLVCRVTWTDRSQWFAVIYAEPSA
jgi:L-histidine N-alpha-methyltransferase